MNEGIFNPSLPQRSRVRSEIEISILLPAYNEENCLGGIIRETVCVLHGMGKRFEIIVVDDGSSDCTPRKLNELRVEVSELRAIRLAKNSGQSAALCAAFQVARGEIFVTLDADGQNDPSDIPVLIAQLENCDLCCGFRANRQDKWAKRLGSRLANVVRNRMLHEKIRDTGCTLKAFRAEWAQSLPLHFRGMHRFIPALMAMAGARISEIEVRHRPRAAGHSKYTNFGRLRETLWDLWAVRWMQSRYRELHTQPLQGAGSWKH